MKRKTIVFCFPGASYTQGFFNSWNDTIGTLPKNGFNVLTATYYSSDIYLCRNHLMTQSYEASGGRPDKFSDVVPFSGLEYDYLFWIDSDQVWKPEDVLRLIDHDRDIVSGFTPLAISNKAAVGYFNEQEGAISYINLTNLKKVWEAAEEGVYPARKDGSLLDVDFVGFAFLAIKRGVMEAIGYPWFRPQRLFVGGRESLTSEDVGWCISATEAGFKIHADPNTVVGHQKTILLTGDKLKVS